MFVSYAYFILSSTFIILRDIFVNNKLIKMLLKANSYLIKYFNKFGCQTNISFFFLVSKKKQVCKNRYFCNINWPYICSETTLSEKNCKTGAAAEHLGINTNNIKVLTSKFKTQN